MAVFQSVKKAANHQNADDIVLILLPPRIYEGGGFARGKTGGSYILNTTQSACYARHFDLLRKPKDYRTHVRRRLWFACLDGFLDLWQSVKKQVF